MVAVTPFRRSTLLALAAVLLLTPIARAGWAPVHALGDVPGRTIQQVLLGTDGRSRLLWTSAYEGATLWESTAMDALPHRLAVLGPADLFPVARTTSAGRAVVIVERRGGYATAQVVARVQRPDGRFSLPVALSTPHQTARAPVLAMDEAGDALAAWRLRDGTVEVARRRHGRLAFTRAGRVRESRDPRADFGALAVFVGPRGRAALVFAARGREHLAMGSVAAGLGRPRSIGPATLPAPAAVATGPGGPLAAWIDDGACRTFPGGLVTAAGAGAAGAPAPAVAIGADGSRIVACPDEGPLRVYTAAAGAPFGETPDLVGTATGFEAPSLALAVDGSALLAWLEASPGGLAPAVAQRAPGAAAFGSPGLLDAARLTTLGPLAALDPGGRALVAWADGRARVSANPG